MKNEKLLFAAVAIIGLALSQALSGIKLPSGYDVGTVFAWVAAIGAIGVVAQFLIVADFGAKKTELWSDKLNDDKFMNPVWDDLPHNIHHKSMFDD